MSGPGPCYGGGFCNGYIVLEQHLTQPTHIYTHNFGGGYPYIAFEVCDASYGPSIVLAFFDASHSYLGQLNLIQGGGTNCNWTLYSGWWDLANVSYIQVVVGTTNCVPGYLQKLQISYEGNDGLQGGATSSSSNTGPGDTGFGEWGGGFFSCAPIGLDYGEKLEQVTDLSLNAPAGTLAFTRTYRQNKQGVYQNLLGLGWTHNHAPTLILLGGSPALAEIDLPTGGELHLTQQSGGDYTGDPGSSVSLALSGSHYILTTVDNTQYVFEQNAFGSSGSYRLNSVLLPNNLGWYYSYDPTFGHLVLVGDAAQNPVRQLQFVYTNGLLQYVGDQTFNPATLSGRHVTFSYTPAKTLDSSGNIVSASTSLLTSVTDVRGNTWTYSYYGQNAGETDTRQLNFLTQQQSPTVDTTGNGAPSGPLTLKQVTYTLQSAELSVDGDMENTPPTTWPSVNSPTTNARSTVQVHTGTYSRYVVTSATGQGIGSNLFNMTVGNHYVITGWVYPAAGTTVKMQLTIGSTVLASVQSQGSNAWELLYLPYTPLAPFSNCQLQFVSVNASASFYADTVSIPQVVLTALTERTGNGALVANWTFQPSGPLLTTETVANRTTSYLFANGVYSGSQDPAGNLSAEYLNPNYQPTTQADPNGHTTLWLWNGDGSLLDQVTDALNHQTTFSYNANNTLASSVDAQGRTTQYTYGDAVNPRSPTQVQVLDTDGKTVLRWQKFSYNGQGQVLSEQTLDPTSGTLQQQVTRTYYTAGNGVGLLRQLVQNDLLNPANTTTATYFYDSAGRTVRTNQSAIFGSCTSSFSLYDAAGNVLASVCNYIPGEAPDPTSLAGVLALYNPALPDQNRLTTYAYDPLGRRISTTTNAGSAGAVTTLTAYDALNRVIRTISNYVPNAAIANPYVHAHIDFTHGPNNDQNLVTDTTFNERGLTRTQTGVLGHVTLYGYDLADQLVKTVQNASQPAYDNSYTTGDPSLSQYTPGSAPDQDVVTTTTYDPSGNAVATTDALGNVTLSGFDPLNRVVRTIRSASQPTYPWTADPTLSAYVPSSAPDKDLIDYTEYDALGHVTRTQDSLGNWTLYGYDGLGRQVKTVRNASQPTYTLVADPTLSQYLPSAVPDTDIITTTTYDGLGRVLYTTDVLGHRTWTVYDGLGRAIKTIANAVGTATDGGPNDPRSAVYTPSANPDHDIITTTTYDTNGYVLFTTNSVGLQTWFAYDSAGRQAKTIVNPTKTATDGSANDPRSAAYVPSALPDRDVITTTAYDPLGRVQSTVDALSNRTWFAYDGLGRRIKTIANAVGTATDGSANDPRSPVYVPSTAADQDLITTTVYDAAGRVTYSQDVIGIQTWFAYDGLGRRVKTIQNPVGTAQNGGPNDPRSASYLPSSLPDRDLITTTVYDRAGRVQYTTDSLGRRSWPVYDALGRVIRTIANAVGTATNGSAADPRSPSYNPVTDSDRDVITATSYDKAGRVAWTQDRFGRRTWNGYDALGRTVRVVANAIGTATDGSVNDPRNPFYAASGSADQDLITTTTYDKAGRAQQTTDPLVIATRYSYDGLGRTVQTVANAVTGTFHAALPDQDLVTTTSYDKAGRMVTSTAPDGQQTTFAYDNLGRRLVTTQAAGTPQASANYTCYDKAGRMLRTLQNYIALAGGVSPDARDTRGRWLFNPATHGAANDQNLITTLTLDKAGRMLSVADPLGNTRQTAHYKDGQVQASTDPLGVVTAYRYDAVRRRALTVQSYQPGAGDPSHWVWNATTARWEQGS